MNIKELRGARGLSQDKLAALLGVAPYTVRRWESGKNKPSPMARMVIKELFGIELEGTPKV